jgi:acyl carrier protein
MSSQNAVPGVKAGITQETISKDVVRILEDLTSDWDTEFAGKIGNDTHIISDLEFESIDVVQFIVQLETIFERKDLPFEKLLMIDGRYKDDLTVGEVVEFLNQYL